MFVKQKMEKRGKQERRKERLNLVFMMLGVFVFRFLLDFSYPQVIYDEFFHYGFAYNPEQYKVILSYVAMLVVLASFIPQVRLERPSSLLLLMVLIMAYVPNMSLFACMGLSYTFFIMSNLFWLSIAFFYNMRLTSRVRIHIPIHLVWENDIKFPAVGALSILYLVFFMVFAYSVYYNHGLSFTVDLSEVKDLRMSARGEVDSLSMYLLMWSGSIIFPIGIILAVMRKKIVLLAFMFLGEIAAFSVNGTKTWLFTAVISLVTALFLKKNSRISLLPWGFVLIVVFCIFLGMNDDLGRFFGNYFIRRVFFSTSLNNYYWIDFFETHDKTFLTNGILGWLRNFIQVPYDTNIAMLIGGLYYDDPLSNASSGTIANAYSNFGWPGLPICAFITVVLAELMDVTSTRSYRPVPLICFFPIIISSSEYLVNGSIFSTAITYGYIPGLILIRYMSHQGVFCNNDTDVTPLRQRRKIEGAEQV